MIGPSRQILRAPGAGIASAGMVYQQGISFLSGLIVARLIGAADYGIVNIARSIVNFIAVFTKLGLDVGLQRHLGSAIGSNGLGRRVSQLVYLRRVAAGAAISVVLVLAFGGASLLERRVFRFDNFSHILIVSALAIPFLTDLGVLGGAYRGLMRPVPTVVADFVIQPTLRLIFIFILFAMGMRLWGVVIATTAAAAAASLLLIYRASVDMASLSAVTHEEDPLDSEDGYSSQTLGVSGVLNFSLVLALTMAVTLATKSLDAWALGHFDTSSAVGQYTLAQTMMVLASIFGASIGQTTGSQIAQRYAADDLLGMQSVMRRQARWTALATAPVCVWLACWGGQLMHIFGPSFTLPLAVLTVLSASQFVVSVLGPSGFALSMTGRHRLELRIQVFGLLLTAAACYVLVPAYGQLGAALSAAVGTFAGNALRVFQIWRRFNIYAVDWLLLIVAATAVLIALIIKLLFVGVGWGQSVVAASGASCVFFLIYISFGFMFLLRADERRAIVRVLSRVFLRTRGELN